MWTRCIMHPSSFPKVNGNEVFPSFRFACVRPRIATCSVYDCKGNRFLEHNRGWKTLDCQKILLHSSVVSVCVFNFAIDFWISNLPEGSFLRRFPHQENMLSGGIRFFLLVPAIKEEVWFVVPTTAVMSLQVAAEVGGEMGVFMVSTLRPSLV